MPKLLLAALVARRRILAIVATALFFAIPFSIAQPAAGQQPTAPEQKSPDQKTSDQKSDDSQEPATTLKVNVNIVQLFFNVKDKHGALIPNLTKTTSQFSKTASRRP